MAAVTGAQVLMRALKRANTERIFTLSGNQILPIYDATLDEAIPVTDTRHEAAAMYMAEAWARLRGEPGVCLVTAGPGHTNAVSGAADASAAEAPVLWLSGGSELATAGMGGFQELDQVALAAPVTKAAWQAKTIAEIPELVARAWRTMLEGRPGPVHLTLPSDILRASVASAPPVVAPESFRPTLHAADPALINEALAILSSAARPLILASPSAARGEAGARLAEFAEASGIPWFSPDSPRGLTDPSLQGVGSAFGQADAVLLLAPQDYVIGFARPERFAAAAKVIQVAPDEREIGRNAPVALGIVGDAGPVLGQLRDSAGEYQWHAHAWRGELGRIRSQRREEMAPAALDDALPLHPLRVTSIVREIAPPNTTVILDGGEFGQWSRWAFGGTEHRKLANGKLGLIGASIPFAVGAALARPGAPAIAFLGDGTFGFHAMEFDTAVRHGIPFVAIVGNDAAWGTERHRQVAIYGEDRIVASDLLPTRYDELARVLGADGIYVETAEQLRTAVKRALAGGRPTCINVRIRSVPSPTRVD